MDWVIWTIGGIILLGFLIGVYRGALRIAVSIITAVLTIFITVFATPYAAQIVEDKTPIDDSIKDNEWNKIDPELNGEMRDEFGNSKNKLINDWENQNDTKWPTYKDDVYSPNGKLIRREGDKYDAHHIQPLTYGGKNCAENINA